MVMSKGAWQKAGWTANERIAAAASGQKRSATITGCAAAEERDVIL